MQAFCSTSLHTSGQLALLSHRPFLWPLCTSARPSQVQHLLPTGFLRKQLRVVLTRPAQLQPGWLPPPLRLGTSSEVTDDSLADANHVLLGDATAGPHQVRGVLPGLHLCLRSCGSLDKDLPCVEGLMNLHPLAGSESGGRNCPFSPGQTAPQKRRWEPYQQLPKP